MTAPYVTGTVSVTAGSAVVTGNGTGWQTGLVIGGLFGLDSANGNPVPILSIDSDTELTLAKPWRGTTAANQAYWIVRDTAYGQQMTANAQALATYIQRLDNASLASLAALAPAADRLPYFNGAGSAALIPLTAFARSLLDDANAAAIWATLGATAPAEVAFRRGNALATVSQSGGVPTGGLIERGSNANGEYTRFADGTQICTKKVSGFAAINTAWGGGFISASVLAGPWPAGFATLPSVSAGHDGGATATVGALVGQNGATVSSAGNYFLYRGTSLATTDISVTLTAIGRWF